MLGEDIMNEKEIYTNSIMTFAFTNDGRMIVKKDKDGKLDTLPWLFTGYHEKNSKIDYEDSIGVINNMNEYKERIQVFFAYHLRDCREAILNGFFTGEGSYLLDCGELYEKIANYQIEEMKNIHNPSYIRVNSDLYDGGINENGQQVINRIETRYVVLPNDDNIENYPDLEAKTIDELRENYSLLSNKVILGISGEDGKIMESFINRLNSTNKSVSPKP